MLLDEFHRHSPSQSFTILWKYFRNIPPDILSKNEVFQNIISLIFYANKVFPLHFSSCFFPYKNVPYDCVTLSKECGPIIIYIRSDCKNSLDEIEMKSLLIRQVHRRSKSFLVSMNAKEAANANKKIANGQILGLDAVIVADTEEFDFLIDELRSYTLYNPEPVEVLTSTRFISG